MEASQLPKFKGGEEEDVQRWLKKLDYHFMATGCTDGIRQLGSALIALAGVAESWAASTSFADFAEFRQRITAEYPCNLSSLVQRIETLQQRASVTQYSQDALNLHSSLPAGTMSEYMLVTHFIRGLKPELRPFVDSACPDTVGRAIGAAKYVERRLAEGHGVSMPPGGFLGAVPVQEARVDHNWWGNNAGRGPPQGNRTRPDNRGPPPPQAQGPPRRDNWQRGPQQPPAPPAAAPTRPANTRGVPTPVDPDAVNKLTEMFRTFAINYSSQSPQVHVFELQPDPTGQAQSSAFKFEEMASSIAAMAAEPAHFGFNTGEQQQLLSQVNGIVQSRAQSLAAEKRARPPGPPYQPGRHRPRFEGFSPDEVDQEMREAAETQGPRQQPAARAPARQTAPARRTTRATVASLDPVEQFRSATMNVTFDKMCALYPSFRAGIIDSVNTAEQRYHATAQAAQAEHNLHERPLLLQSSYAGRPPEVPMKRAAVSVVRVHAYVNGLSVPNAIIDTGSTNTVMSTTLYRRLGSLDNLAKADSTFLTSSGETATPVGVANSCLVSIGDLELPVDVQVTRAVNYELLVGMDWLHMAGASIHIAESCVSLQVDRGVRIEVPIRVEHAALREAYMHATQLQELSTYLQGLYIQGPGTAGSCGMQEESASWASDHPDDLWDDSSSDESFDSDEEPPELVSTDSDSDVGELPEMELSSDGDVDASSAFWPTGQPTNAEPLLGDALPFSGFTVQGYGPSDADDLCMEDVMPWELHEDTDVAAFNLEHLSAEQQVVMKELLRNNLDVFAFDTSQLGSVTAASHRIHTGDAPPIRAPVRRFSPSERQDIIQHVGDMLAADVIEESASPWRFSPVLVPKKTGDTRFCINFRRLNDVTIHDSYALPLIGEILDDLGPATFFSLLDMRSGYWQLLVDAQDREKTAFWTPLGLYHFKRMPFGLSTAPSTFQRFTDLLLRGLPFARAFLDDICVFSTSFEEHVQHLHTVFSRARAYDAKFHPGKCEFLPEQLHALGHVVTREGVLPNENKVDALRNMPAPTDRTTVRSFLGLASYYRRFIQGFAAIALPLTELTRKSVPWHWDGPQQAAFEALKERLSSAPVLVRPDFSLPFTLATDWRPGAVGAVLSQPVDGLERVIAYASQTLLKSQLSWSATDGECWAVIWAVKHFRPYLYGRHFVIVTDHAALQYLMSSRTLGGRLLRWSVALQEYTFTVRYRPGREHANADALSRLAQPGTEATLLWDCGPPGPPMVLMTAGTAAPSVGGGGEPASELPGEPALAALELPASPGPDTSDTAAQPQGSPVPSSPDQFADTACCICAKGEDELGANMLLCEGCHRGFHLHCLDPPLSAVPEGEWLCSACLKICADQSKPVQRSPHSLKYLLQVCAERSEAAEGSSPALEKDLPCASKTVDSPDSCLTPNSPALEETALDIFFDTPAHMYLTEGRLPEDLPPSESKRAKARSKRYRVLDNGRILKVDPNGSGREVPPPGDRAALIARVHEDLGHYAARAVYDALRRSYFWALMEAQVKAFVEDCKVCRERLVKFDYKPAELHPIPVTGIVHRLHVDLKGPLPVTKLGNRYIAVAVDSLSKWPEAMPLPDKTAASTSRFMLDVLSRHGCPSVVVTDNGREFEGNFAQLLQRNSIEHMHTSAYHPQANGLVERMNRTMMQSVERLVAAHQSDWDVCLPITLWGYRTSMHASTRLTPFLVLYGREARMPVDILSAANTSMATPEAAADDEASLATLATARIDNLQQVHELALSNIERAQQRQAKAYKAAARPKKRKAPADSPPSGEVTAPPEPCPFQPGKYVYVQKPKQLRAADALDAAPEIFKVKQLNSKETTATLADKHGNEFNAHVSRMSLYQPLKVSRK